MKKCPRCKIAKMPRDFSKVGSRCKQCTTQVKFKEHRDKEISKKTIQAEMHKRIKKEKKEKEDKT